MIKLGVMDQVYIGEGRTAMRHCRNRRVLRKRRKRSGHSRFWISEHHGHARHRFFQSRKC